MDNVILDVYIEQAVRGCDKFDWRIGRADWYSVGDEHVIGEKRLLFALIKGSKSRKADTYSSWRHELECLPKRWITFKI
jgi:hypothetical protein